MSHQPLESSDSCHLHDRMVDHIKLFLYCFSCLRLLRCWFLLNKLTVYGITTRGNVPIPSLETRCNQIYHQSRNVKRYHLRGTSCLSIRCLLTSYSDHQMAVTGEAFASTFSCTEMWIFFCFSNALKII